MLSLCQGYDSISTFLKRDVIPCNCNNQRVVWLTQRTRSTWYHSPVSIWTLEYSHASHLFEIIDSTKSIGELRNLWTKPDNLIWIQRIWLYEIFSDMLLYVKMTYLLKKSFCVAAKYQPHTLQCKSKSYSCEDVKTTFPLHYVSKYSRVW
jgi:hypothetical protein